MTSVQMRLPAVLRAIKWSEGRELVGPVRPLCDRLSDELITEDISPCFACRTLIALTLLYYILNFFHLLFSQYGT